MKQEAEARAKVYQEKLAQLEGELKVARQALVEAGKGEKERIVREAEDRAERMRKDAQLLVEQELAQLRHDLVRDTVNTAMVAAEDMLRASVTPADQERLAEEFLKDLSSKTRSSTVGGAS
jgi:F-type H+-transporting ATPase subunit b